MKYLCILLFLGLSNQVLAQSKEDYAVICEDSTLFRVLLDYEASLEINLNNQWQSFNIFNHNDIDRFSANCSRMELTGSGHKELILDWENHIYGSCGGMTLKGVQIWDLDHGQLLFDEITYCSEESFGRDGDSYYVFCETPVTIESAAIKVDKQKCTTERSENGATSDPTENCDLSDLSPGTYSLKGGELAKTD